MGNECEYPDCEQRSDFQVWQLISSGVVSDQHDVCSLHLGVMLEHWDYSAAQVTRVRYLTFD